MKRKSRYVANWASEFQRMKKDAKSPAWVRTHDQSNAYPRDGNEFRWWCQSKNDATHQAFIKRLKLGDGGLDSTLYVRTETMKTGDKRKPSTRDTIWLNRQQCACLLVWLTWRLVIDFVSVLLKLTLNILWIGWTKKRTRWSRHRIDCETPLADLQ